MSHACPITAAVSASIADLEEIQRRNADITNMLSISGLKSVDVADDGNCFFRAASYVLYGTQNYHAQLRQQVASKIEEGGSILEGIVDQFPDDGLDFAAHVKDMRTNGRSVGVDAAIALSSLFQRKVVIYIAYGEPQVFTPTEELIEAPIVLAKFEPGHYRAVVPSTYSK